MKPPVVPDHTLLRPVGHGAYGEVWLARNVMGTLRAVKIVWRKQFSSERPYEREFAGIQRYEPLSRSADGLVHVLHVGRNDAEGYFYYVMELADDSRLPESDVPQSDPLTTYSPRTLRSEMKGIGRLPTADCLRIALDVAGGLAQLHRRGLVHRDVKPGNIIYVEGRAKLADIGLVTEGDEHRTFVGTEGYIPPEGPGSASADLYALGIVLYEASTGYAPERFPEAPPEWFAEEAPAEPLEFHQIILRAGEGQRERRYENVEAMQADLALLQSGQSIRKVRALEQRLRRWRRLGRVAAAGIAIALIVAGLAYYRSHLMSANLVQETRLRDEAQKALERAKTAEEETRRQLYAALREQARATLRSGEFGQRERAFDAVRRAASITNTAELRGIALAAMLLPDLHYQRELKTGPGITVAWLDPQFRRLALCRGRDAVEICSATDEKREMQLPASTNLPAYAAAWSPQGTHLAVKRDKTSSGDLADVEFWDVNRARQVLLLRDLAWGATAFHPQDSVALASHPDGSVSLHKLEAGQELRRLRLPGTAVRLQFAPDGGRFAAVCSEQGTEVLRVFDAASGTNLASHAFSHHIGIIDWHPRGRWISAPDSSGAVTLVDSFTGESRLLGHHKAEAVTTTFHPAGTYLISGGWDRELICWDMASLQDAFVMNLGSFLFQFRADGLECAAIADPSVQLHSFDSPNGRAFIEDLGPHVRHAAFSPDARWLAASGEEKLGVWDLRATNAAALDTGGSRARLNFAEDGSELFASQSSGVNRWKILSAANTAPSLHKVDFPKIDGPLWLGVQANNLLITAAKGTALAAPDNLALTNLTWRPTTQGPSEISPDGRFLGVCAPYSAVLNVYSLPSLAQVGSITNEEGIGDFAFAPSGNLLAAASHHAIEFWNIKTWKRTSKVPGFMGILFNPDGRTAWFSQDFRTSGLYELKSQKLLLPLPPGMWPLSVSQDGRWLATSTDARRVCVIDLQDVRAQIRRLGLDWEAAAK